MYLNAMCIATLPNVAPLERIAALGCATHRTEVHNNPKLSYIFLILNTES